MWKYRGTQLDGEQFSTGTYTATLGKNNMVPGIDQGNINICFRCSFQCSNYSITVQLVDFTN